MDEATLVSGNLGALWLQRFHFTLRCSTTLHLSEFVGNDLHGAFGFILRHHACLSRQSDGAPCARCDDHERCLYGFLFASQDQRGQEVARPYIIEPLFPHRARYGPGSPFAFNLVLVGSALNSFTDCLWIIQQIGRRGLGRDYRSGQGRFEVEQVAIMDNAGAATLIYQHGVTPAPSVLARNGISLADWTTGLTPQRLIMHFVSPLHLRDPKPPRQPLRDLEFHHLWDSLQQRLEQLMPRYCGTRYESSFKTLKKQALAVRKVEASLRWQAQPRRTSQHQLVDMGGLLGHVVFEGDLTPFLPVLAVGAWTHLGHGCDLGNGQYRLMMRD